MSNLHKRQLYAGIFEIIKNDKYYYNSHVSKNYSRLTEDGQKAIIEFVELMAPYMIQKEQQEFELRAKATVWNELAR